jgi:hypothetical protein
MKGRVVSIPYSRIFKRNKKHTTLKLKNKNIVILLSPWITLNKEGKTVDLPEWYARKEKLI